MICPRCRALSPEGSSYCFQCGAALGALDEFTFSDATGMDGMPTTEGPLADVPEVHWFLVLVYNIITLGIYGSVWFLRRLGAFQRLRSERKLNPGLLVASLMFIAAGLMLSFVSGLLEGFSEAQGLTTRIGGLSTALDHLSTFIDILATFLIIHQSLTLRRMIKDHVAAQGRHVAITALWTILFQNINLQHAINGIKRHGRS